MNAFRAIYHADPDNKHAPAAVAQVAELLREKGIEFGDKKSVHDAAGQYEYLAKAYPGDKLAAEALVDALALLGPTDADEAEKVRAELVQDYPREAKAAGVEVAGMRGSVHPTHDDGTITDGAPGSGGDLKGTRGSLGRREEAVAEDASLAQAAPVVREEETSGRMGPEAGGKATGPLSVVTGIRHWSTASYTRVAIDLNVAPGEEVKYEAARVENPDRIFFDLGHARLAPELAGKSFSVTDDGFLTRVRAAQFNDEVTRVVLDVHHVTEYSAFLLPNPYRLIIDIHGGGEGQEVGIKKQDVAKAGAGNAAADFPVADAGGVQAGMPVGNARRGGQAVEVSSLPPMPVTDGSASFGLPARSTDRVGEGKAVAQPRVVIASKATAARPVPNTVVRNSADTSSEVADVSKQPGMVEATHRPTSKPIAETSGDAATDAHYVPRSRRRAAADAGVSAVPEVRGEPAAAAPPTADGETSLMRALGLKIGRIVIDAGHGAGCGAEAREAAA
jgi:N-acetylmuramoyl-L-alanine amidase